MGKWSSNHYDEVLNAKMKSLVSGAIRRSKLEKSEPTISYENFVEELDSGDSFTTSVIDILVKELAERKTRETVTDRRLIADRTAKNLRMLATPLRVYRDNPPRQQRRHISSSSRRATNLEYLTAPPEELELEDEDDLEFDTMMEPNAAASAHELEGLIFSQQRSRSPSSTPSPPITAAEPAGVSASQTSRLVSTTSLARQPSIRRSIRSRIVDFNDFTSQRRSSSRSESIEPGGGSEASERDQEWGSTRTNANGAARRFFPLVRSYRTDPNPWRGWHDEAEAEADADARATAMAEPTPSSPAWLTFPHNMVLPSPVDASRPMLDLSEERINYAAPPPARLRRGGVRAPEYIASTASRARQSFAVDSRGFARLPLPARVTPREEPEEELTRVHVVDADVTRYPTPGSGSDHTS